MKRSLLTAVLCGICTAELLAQSSVPPSPLSQLLQPVEQKMEKRQKDWLDAQGKKVKYDTIGLAQYRADWAELKKEKKQLEINFVKAHPADTLSLVALKDVVGYLPEDITYYQQLFTKLAPAVQSTKAGLDLQTTIDKFMTVRVGAIAPSFSAPDTSGNSLSLESLRGKYVLIDFWASWCGPCREENPVVVKAYEQFKHKGFTILSVSLDQAGQKAAWVKAIQADQLNWYHVSELQHWNSAIAQTYAVRSIPQNFLLDPTGKIIAANLRGHELTEQLEKLIH